MLKGAIFDVDGTLLDSMPIWEDAGARYLKSIQVEPEEHLSEILWNMTIPEGAAYVKKQYHLSVTEEEIIAGIIGTVRTFYEEEATLKPGARAFLEDLRKRKIPMVIATTSNRSYLEAAFERTGIHEYFDRIFTCDEVGAGKTKPVIYQVAAEYLGFKPEEIFVFEDAEHAIMTAKQAHFQVVAIYDAASAHLEESIRENSDLYLKDFTETEAFWTYVENE
ncbi:MAG: HAD family phosphatase [Dorea sp.]|nr:HAD family phosphatase [Dorea sp.]